MLRVYGDRFSGNCYKIQLLLSQLDREYVWENVDVLSGATRNPEFLNKNPNGKIPVLETDQGFLWESNAILLFLAQDSRFYPEADWARAKVFQWLFFEQYSHEPYIATARFIVRYLNSPPDRLEDLKAKMDPGYRALSVLEQTLSKQSFLVGQRYSVADIALYAYTHVCEEGGFSLENFPAVRNWLQRVANEPNYVAMG